MLLILHRPLLLILRCPLLLLSLTLLLLLHLRLVLSGGRPRLRGRLPQLVSRPCLLRLRRSPSLSRLRLAPACVEPRLPVPLVLRNVRASIYCTRATCLCRSAYRRHRRRSNPVRGLVLGQRRHRRTPMVVRGKLLPVGGRLLHTLSLDLHGRNSLLMQHRRV